MVTLMKLIAALIAVESGGDANAVGDDGLAYGVLQMHAVYVQDAAEFAGEDWTHEDAFDKETSVEIFKAYMARYATEGRVGLVTAEKIARIHNGGPNGHNKQATDKYWAKVRAELVKN
jgi:hypothetical protein